MGDMKFTAPPTVARFMQSQAFVRPILGPVGSGKSTGCLIELIRRMTEQAPAHDGTRHTRFAIVRQTLQQIKQTVLKEFYTWLGPITNFKVSENTIYIEFTGEDGVRVSSEVHLIPLDDADDQRRLLSMQLTGVWINEFPEVDPGLVPSICGRLGRYPSSAQGGCTWFGLIMDGNFPTEGGEWHKLLEIETPPDWQVFKQPGGLDPGAENIENLPGGLEYYRRLSRGQSKQWIDRYVNAKYGEDPSGSGVFKESFNKSFHVVDEVLPVRGHPLLIGQDFGRDPCSVICQLDHLGRLLVLQEVIADDIGLQLHIQRGLRPALADARYAGLTYALIGDPAGNQRSTILEETTFDFLKRQGFTGIPAATNDLDQRLRGVEGFLLQQRNGGPAIMFDKQRCPMLIQAMAGGYRYAKKKDGELKPLPDKNKYSHVSDALQYAAMTAHSGMANLIIRRIMRAPGGNAQKPRMGAGGWT